jgi:hypothetical protein
MTAPMGCRVIGRWRIVEADIWERDYLDLLEPAMRVISADGHGEIALGALQAGLGLAYGRADVSFTFLGSDEMDEVRGSGSAELLEDGTLEIEFDFEQAMTPASVPNARIPQQPANGALIVLLNLCKTRL